VTADQVAGILDEAALLARRLPLTGTFNVRDIGGYRSADGRSVKWNTLWRGDALHRVDDQGRQVLVEMGLRMSLDLREPGERTAAPDLMPEGVELVSLPLFSSVAPETLLAEQSGPERRDFTTLDEAYFLLVDRRGPALAQAVRALLDPGALPAIVHCTAGKDRTGIVVALVLAALGVPDEVIAADFAATSLFLNEEFRQSLLAHVATVGVSQGLDEERRAAMLACGPELILRAIDRIRYSHGGVEQYLLHHGMTLDELGQLRSLLLEETPSRAPDKAEAVKAEAVKPEAERKDAHA
jgi:protein-tyrosine phosphatase